MKTLYTIIVQGYGIAIRLASLFGNSKAKLWVNGRENWSEKVKKILAKNTKPVIWIHASSTGEFEQGRTVIESLKMVKQDHFFLLTFFSPSGFLQHENYDQVDAVCYLPLDSRINAKIFLHNVNPKVAVFVKYEFWLFYFQRLAKLDIPLFLVSAKLTKDHLFFKWYGAPYRKVLRLPTLFFVQDKSTDDLLKKLEVDNVMITGDTRIDRVLEISSVDKTNEIAERFLNKEKAVIVGSSWETEEKMVADWINSGAYSGKIIIAPHEIDELRIKQFVNSLKVETVRYTEIEQKMSVASGQVLIIDCIGILKELYRYGSWAYIGGGFSDGIHNTLEPAVFGLPLLFGPKYKKFGEAVDLIEQGGAVSIRNYSEFIEQSALLTDSKILDERSSVCKAYIEHNKGATKKVVEQLNQYL